MNKELCDLNYLRNHLLINPHKYYEYFIRECPTKSLDELIYVEWLVQEQAKLLESEIKKKLRNFSLLLEGKSFTDTIEFMKKFNYHVIRTMLKQDGWEEFKAEKSEEQEIINDLLGNNKIQQRMEEIKKNHEELIGMYNAMFKTNYQPDLNEIMKQLLEEISDELGEDIESE